jgi:hypothetical protein
MASLRRLAPKAKSSKDSKSKAIPAPYKEPPEVLRPFIDGLSKKHLYITHIDAKPASFKRKIFLVPIAMNLAVVVAFVFRMRYILPWYWQLLMSGFGHPNETTFPVESSTWGEFGMEVGWRGLIMFFDFLLAVFVWPWPVEFVAATAHGNPCRWRWHVGFREKEIYVRRSRDWDTVLGEDFLYDDTSKRIIKAYVEAATSPLLQEQKTGYLLMNGSWNLDWDAMVHAHALVDTKEAAIEAFRNVVLVHHKDFGWLCYDIKVVASAFEDEKRRQVFAFRDALTAMGKENLFYRWVEIVQFEATQPGGFGPDKQEAAAKQIRELFEKDGINFDELWQQTAGPENNPN